MENIIFEDNITGQEIAQIIKALLENNAEGAEALRSNAIYLVPCNNDYYIGIGFYTEDVINKYKYANKSSEVFLTFGAFNSQNEFRALPFINYDTYEVAPACMNYVDLLSIRIIIDLFKSLPALPNGFRSDNDIYRMYSKLWESWDTLLAIKKDVGLDTNKVLDIQINLKE